MPHDMSDAARAVLEYAASLGLVAPAQPAASRQFRRVPDDAESVMLQACEAAGYSERVTITMLSRHAAKIEGDMMRLLENASPKTVVPIGDFFAAAQRDLDDTRRALRTHVPGGVSVPTPPDDRAERLTEHRENVRAIMQGYAANWTEMRREWAMSIDDGKTRGFEAWLVAKAEHIAQCMLAVERTPPNAR
jgi:hypothetical protein